MEEQRKHPEKAGSYCAGDTQRNKIGLEFSPSGSCFVNYRAEKHVVDNIPDAVDDVLIKVLNAKKKKIKVVFQ